MCSTYTSIKLGDIIYFMLFSLQPSVHVVIDTNIWMGDMHFARTLFDKSISGKTKTIIVLVFYLQ